VVNLMSTTRVEDDDKSCEHYEKNIAIFLQIRCTVGAGLVDSLQ